MSWDEVLDDLEARIDQAETALDNDEALPVSAFVPPAGISPLPESLRERALAVLRRQGELEDRIENLKLTLNREITATTRSGRAPSPFAEASAPRYFDSHA